MKEIQGIAAARGFAWGPAFQFRPVELDIERRAIGEPDEELKRLEQALAAAGDQIQAVFEKAKAEMSEDQASIFEAQLLMLQDPELGDTMRRWITEQRLSAEFAVQEATENYARTLEGMDSTYFKSRAADVRDIAQRVEKILLGYDPANMNEIDQPSIVIARDLMPSDTVQLDKRLVLGFCTVEGSETSHTAILARGLGIPAVVGSGLDVLSIANGRQLILDGLSGKVFVDPTREMLEEYQAREMSLSASDEDAIAHCQEPAVTRDGCRVEVVANIGGVAGAKAAVEKGAEGVGLLRSEFLYMERETLPNEEEQYQAYSTILDAFGERPVTLRTSDIGGDKALPYLDLAKEVNPFLGVRGLRLALLHADKLFKPQLRAALRAGTGHDLRIMFPMVATLGEIRQARQSLEECRAQLIAEDKPIAERLQVGIMIEIPSAALLADLLAPEVDFFSIGTNDLTQYTLAADRTNSQLAYLASAFSPAVLRLIQNVILQAHEHGKRVAVCGELAGEALGIPTLLGLGLDEFSMNPQSIPAAKQTVRGLNLSDCQQLAAQVLKLESADEVKAFVRNSMPRIADPRA